MTYPIGTYIELADKIASTSICAVDEYPNDFKVATFIATADAYLEDYGVVEFLKSGIYTNLVNTLTNVTGTYDFDDYDEHLNLERFRTYSIYKVYSSWYWTNRDVDDFFGNQGIGLSMKIKSNLSLII